MLILAGDVSDDLPTLRQTLQVLKARFAHVFFTPGEVLQGTWCLSSFTMSQGTGILAEGCCSSASNL